MVSPAFERHRGTALTLEGKRSRLWAVSYTHLDVYKRQARTSTDEQTTALQLAALKRAQCSSIFEDKGLSGASVKRPALARCLKTLRAGDTLIVWKLDRLGRSLRDLIAMLDDLRARGVKFHSLTEAIDTTTSTGRAMWQMIGVLAELERSLISERTRAGVKAAQRRSRSTTPGN